MCAAEIGEIGEILVAGGGRARKSRRPRHEIRPLRHPGDRLTRGGRQLRQRLWCEHVHRLRRDFGAARAAAAEGWKRSAAALRAGDSIVAGGSLLGLGSSLFAWSRPLVLVSPISADAMRPGGRPRFRLQPASAPVSVLAEGVAAVERPAAPGSARPRRADASANRSAAATAADAGSARRSDRTAGGAAPTRPVVRGRAEPLIRAAAARPAGIAGSRRSTGIPSAIGVGEADSRSRCAAPGCGKKRGSLRASSIGASMRNTARDHPAAPASLASASHAASSSKVTPSAAAFVAFEPGSAPVTT